MHPLEEKLVELLQDNKEQNGINALHYLEAFSTLSRVTTAVFENKTDNLAKLIKNEKTEPGTLQANTVNLQWASHYLKLFGELKIIDAMITELRDEQSNNNQLEELLQAERENT